ncbi:MAG: carboxypeptidase regulatory-like domain-containing protein [Deltaproteobacteria bacterium]|nr:carboxypeptidase regulatory-like domain-containing protein [Deltaproteobacteria bacterium]
MACSSKAISCICAAALLALCSPARAQGPAQVNGWVIGLAPGQVAVIKLVGPREYRCSTRPGGQWSVEGVAPGAYTVFAKLPGVEFTPTQRRIQVRGGTVGAVNFRRQSEPAEAPDARRAGQVPAALSIAGWVRGLAGGERILVKASGPTPAQAHTRPGGHFQLEGLAAGTYRLRFESERYRIVPPTILVKLEGADRKGLRFKARPRKAGPAAGTAAPAAAAEQRYTLRGRVDGLKALLHGCTRATVIASGPSTASARTRTGEEDCGSFVLRDLEPGSYVLRVRIPPVGTLRWRVSPSKRKIELRGDVGGVVFDARSYEHRH